MAIRRKAKLARKLRRDMTGAERILWRALREARPGLRVRRQHPVGHHIVDFAIPAHKLAIEIDGGQHAQNIGTDTERTRRLAEHGYRVIRFWNNEVTENPDGVVSAILAKIALSHLANLRPGRGYPPHPDPLLPGGEGDRNRETQPSPPRR